jgi:superfamily I DNA/RNA helicase
VLAIAFTNRSARELTDRLAVLLGERAARRAAVATFHAACHRFLVRPHAARLGRSPGFSIYDTNDARALLPPPSPSGRARSRASSGSPGPP